MSLDDMPEQSLRQLVGRLETLQSEWAIATTRARRKEVDDQFRALASQVRERFGDAGQRAVNALLARHQERHL
ncbi:MAG: hypothetical protein JRM80_03830 [Nitrososphaerota archaeon]|nr:hypothetical protein [Nitrososphaerota archaeon]